MSTDLRIAAILIPIDDLSLLSMTLKEAIALHSPIQDYEGEWEPKRKEEEELHKKCAYSLGRILKKVDYLIKLHHAPRFGPRKSLES